MIIKKQDDSKDCGLYVIQALHKHIFGKWIDIDDLRRDSLISPSGMNVNSMINLGSKYGLKLEAYNVSVEQLKENVNKFYIGIIENEGENHYVIFKFNNKSFAIYDSVKGHYKLSVQEFESIFKNIIITYEQIEFIPNTYSDEKIFTYLFKNKSLLIWIMITSLLAIIFSFTTGIFSKIILDQILPGGLNDLLSITVITFIFIAIIRALNKFLNSFLQRKLNLIIEIDLLSKYFTKLRKASLIEINKISRNDHFRRIGAIENVSQFISSGAILFFDEVIVFILSTSFLIYINPSMFGIALAFTLVIVFITIIFKVITKEKHELLIEANFNSLQCQLEKIEMIPSLKNIDEYLYSDKNFINKTIIQKTQEYSLMNALSLQNLFNEIIKGVAPVVLMFVGVKYIFNNELSIGTIMMFVSLFNSFTSPLISLCDFVLTINQNIKAINLLKYVINSKEENININGIKGRKIKNIELKNIEFSYDKPLINISHLIIDESIFLEGKNGSGKSTLINLINLKYISGGEIYFNGIEKDYYNLDDLRNRIYTSSSKTFLPSMSIYEYITLGNSEAIKNFENSLVLYDLPKLIKSFGIKLEHQIINNGENLSSGQKQFVQLLRLFAFEYDVVILDEAFENIDANNFKHLSSAILDAQKGIYIEVSHSKKYIKAKKGVDLEKIN